MEVQQPESKSWIKNLVILFLSLFVFFRLGLLKTNVNTLLMVIIVLAIHEVGHFLGMRSFGYRNVQMLFVPFLGATVSGESRNVPIYKKQL